MTKFSQFEKDSSAGSYVNERAVGSLETLAGKVPVGFLEVWFLELAAVTPALHAVGRRDLEYGLGEEGRAL